ncbi:DUF2785 domain-containing protein [Methanocella arvoryzae]|uniref:DUF2785 domain-containing protein n=1 Tax=Methanocella arvoryzae (strain DSM 22066 / NBRC 105507 / MRE50) TaxID=351160 RepID=Q0W2E4_METAR|nr:DUF2785 domain-containing protein [Methanocella arvoryzae]CAJ37449.1 conserved hypothetical protein [Methanocella arvoryzae MRE50]
MTTTVQTLKERLSSIRGNPGQSMVDTSLVSEMLASIGSTDPVLRDDLIYETFAGWIETDQFSPGELKRLLNVCLDDSHAFYRIGEEGTDSVFTRTFSLLVVALILDAHRRNSFLTPEDVREVKAKMVRYMAEEKDVRGYVGEKGWAHSTAHAADVLGELAKCGELEDKQDLLDILHVISEKVIIGNYIYIHKEDERLARAVVGIFGRGILDDREIAGWLERFGDIQKSGSHPGDDYLRNNVKMFLRSLYFRLSPDGSEGQIRPLIESVLQKLSKF